MLVTALVCPRHVRSSCPWFGSHSSTLPSSPAVASSEPPAEKVTALTLLGMRILRSSSMPSCPATMSSARLVSGEARRGLRIMACVIGVLGMPVTDSPDAGRDGESDDAVEGEGEGAPLPRLARADIE